MGLLIGGGVVEEVRRGLFDDGEFQASGFAEGSGAVVSGQIGDTVRINPAVVNEALHADEQRIAGESGERGVGRASVAGRAERQHLPEALLRGSEEVDERISGGAEVSNAAVGRQGGNVQKDSGQTILNSRFSAHAPLWLAGGLSASSGNKPGITRMQTAGMIL